MHRISTAPFYILFSFFCLFALDFVHVVLEDLSDQLDCGLAAALDIVFFLEYGAVKAAELFFAGGDKFLYQLSYAFGAAEVYVDILLAQGCEAAGDGAAELAAGCTAAETGNGLIALVVEVEIPLIIGTVENSLGAIYVAVIVKISDSVFKHFISPFP